MKRPSLSLVGAILVATGVVVNAQQDRPPREQRGGPAGEFKSETPDHLISVVQFAPTASSAGLNLLSKKDVEVQVKAEGMVVPSHLSLKANVPQSVKVSGLAKQCPYIVTGDGFEVQGTLRPLDLKQETFCFDIQADSHLDENSSLLVYTQSLKSMAKDSPAFVVDLGDTFMTEKHKDFRESAGQYLAQHYYMGLVDAPWFLSLGNHDGEQGWIERSQPEMASWASAQRKLFLPPPTTAGIYSGNTDKANYYAIQKSNALFVMLDPFSQTKNKPNRPGSNWNMTLGETQYRWLAQTLKESKAKFRFVFVHNLVGGVSKNSRGGAEASAFYEWGGQNEDGTDGFVQNRSGWDMPIHNLLVKYKVNAVFHGHDHFYAKQERDGIVYQLVPQPSTSRSNAYASAAEYSYKSGKILSGSGYVRVTVSKNSAIVEYVKSGLETAVEYSYSILPSK